MDQTISRYIHMIKDLREEFLNKAGEYFDADIREHEKTAEILAMDMALMKKRARALYIAQQKHK